MPGVDLVTVIEDILPFGDQTFTEILCSHVLEHFADPRPIMNEFWRVLKHEGTVKIIVPWWAGEWQRGDPTHRRAFDHNSFSVFSDWWERYRYQGIKGPWRKLTQTYQRNKTFHKDRFLREAGFSNILAMEVVLQKP